MVGSSQQAGKAVPFYIGEIFIAEEAGAASTSSTTGGGGVGSASTETATAGTAEKFTTITFEDGKDNGFIGRGNVEKLTVTKEANHTSGGSYALKVEGRQNTWHGPALHLEKYINQGGEYKISVWAKLIDPASSQLQLSTQVGNGNSANYVNLSAKSVAASDGWVEFTGTYRYGNTSSGFLLAYMESSSNATASFYIDDISIESTGSGKIEIQKDIASLKDVYGKDFLIGNAISSEDMEGVRLDLLKKHNNAATAGNAMKPGSLQSVKGVFTFDDSDKMIKQVQAAGLKMHGHVLVWHQQSPAWMNTKAGENGETVPLSREEALDNLRTHIKTVVEHYGNKVISWDVVNEAMNDNPSNPSDWKASLRKTMGLTSMWGKTVCKMIILH
jgi:endo-1,4-beta-xylanase